MAGKPATMFKTALKSGLEKLGYSIHKSKRSENKPSYLNALFSQKLNPQTFSFCYEGFGFIKALQENCSARFELDGSAIKVHISSVTYSVKTWEELYILNELFVEGCYNFQLKDSFIFIDVGMNVAMTSILFSSNPQCKKVIAFEPIAETIAKAQVNLQQNSCADKIEVNPVGLGYPARTVEVDYSEQYKASVGIKGIEHQGGGTRTLLQIVDVFESLEATLQTTEKVVMKIDCEGGEYEIIERMKNTSILTKVDFYMIEWHKDGPSKLKEAFVSNGFQVLSFQEGNTVAGMLYAFK